MAIGVLLLVGSALVLAHGQQHEPAPSVTVAFSSVFFDDAQHRYERLPLLTGWTDKELKALVPRHEGEFAMVGLECSGHDPQGKLEACTIRLEPETFIERSKVEALTDGLRIDPVYLGSEHPPVRFISIQLRMTHSASPPNRGPCWPPSCSFIPAPPPPPPLPSNR
jgi:hypothetical protein